MTHRAFLCAFLLAFAQIAMASDARSRVDRKASAQAIDKLPSVLASVGLKSDWLAEVADSNVAHVPLTSEDAHLATELLWKEHTRRIKKQRAAEMEAQRIELDDARMPFFLKRFGKTTDRGPSLYISMHGGGGAPARVNDQQWENQKRLYQPEEGIYVAPRAPSNEWDLWHRSPVGRLFDRLIENLIVMENVDSNHVYLMGYSAGGDGTYQLAPRMADRWAAAAMMAGHPNDASPLGLRNVGFILQVGGRDTAYQRNAVAATWGKRLAKLRKNDPDGYNHFVKIYPEKGHWMDREDAIALPWMAKFTRNPLPDRVVWHQDDVTRNRFYWLGVADGKAIPHANVVATLDKKSRQVNMVVEKATDLSVFLNDAMGNLDQPWTVKLNGKQVFRKVPRRTIAVLADSLSHRGDRELMFSAKIPIR